MSKYISIVFLSLYLCILSEGVSLAQLPVRTPAIPLTEDARVDGVTNGRLIFKYSPLQTLKDGKWEWFGVLPDFKNSWLISQSPDGTTTFKTPITSAAIDIKRQRVNYVVASVEKKGEEIVHPSSINYVRVDHVILSKDVQTVVLEPILDSDGKIVEGHVLLVTGSKLVISLVEGASSLLVSCQLNNFTSLSFRAKRGIS